MAAIMACMLGSCATKKASTTSICYFEPGTSFTISTNSALEEEESPNARIIGKAELSNSDEGLPINGRQVMFAEIDSLENTYSSITDSLGNYQIDLPPGDYEMKVDNKPSRLNYVITLKAGEVRQLNFRTGTPDRYTMKNVAN